MKNIKNYTYFQLASMPMTSLFHALTSSAKGLTVNEADNRLKIYGRNEIQRTPPKKAWQLFIEAFISPFTLILIALAIISLTTEFILAAPTDKDATSAVIILTLVLLSGCLSFVQTLRSQQAAESLDHMVEVTSAVQREHILQEIPTEHLVIGDIIHLSAGDMIPADIRLFKTKDLFVSQTALTGESYPVEKKADAMPSKDSATTSYETMVFMGTEVVSGTAQGIIVRTAADSLLGDVAKALDDKPTLTSFDKGIQSTSYLLIRFMLILAPTVILINGLTKGDWLQALLFGISVAVGLTPEMLPMIVTSNLVKGAQGLAKEGTVVRNLNAIQNFGAIDVLCTDKTGTLTQDKVTLQYHLDIEGNESPRVLRHGYLNSFYQTGLKNLMDKAIIEAADNTLDTKAFNYEKVDEIPFDFDRRRMSVVVQDASGKTQLITKGAIEEMLEVSTYVEHKGVVTPLDTTAKEAVLTTVNELNAKGLRVIGISQKADPDENLSVKDEANMVLIGYLAFLDPPKETTAEAIAALKAHGVDIKILTGDNALVTQAVCKQVGIDANDYLSSEVISRMTKEELVQAVEDYAIFVKLTPSQKADIVSVLRENGHVVGFMGDGINDSPAMKAADVGISVDNAVDIAKEAADIILLDKDLMVLEKGIVSGRKVFGNILKYINATTSSNFGNMFSVLFASIFLPFLPMLPMQLLFLNIIYDVACLAIPWDNVDADYLKQPKKWETKSIQRFMLWFGPTSSIFDLITFAVMYFIIGPSVMGANYHSLSESAQVQFTALFHTGWFLVSLWTQTLVLYTLRTDKLPFIQSRPSKVMMLITLLTVAIGTFVPFTYLGTALDLTAMPTQFWAFLSLIIIGYMLLVTIVKRLYIRRYGQLF